MWFTAVDIVSTRGGHAGMHSSQPLQWAASMVMTGAYVGITGLVGLDATIEGMRVSIPPYRTQHIAGNETAIRAGFERVEHLAAPAWEGASI